MSYKITKQLERRAVRKYVDAVLKAGFEVEVFDGEEFLPRSTNKAEIVENMFAVDGCELNLYRPNEQRWMKFIFGNEPWEVLNDYSVALEEILEPVNAAVEKWAN